MPASCVHEDESGLTLVELMVAFGLLSIILAAAAGSLITFGKSAVDNERRVQATAVANRLHEQLQALPWQDAALYADELPDLTAVPEPLSGLDLTARTFEGRDLVVIDGPGSCPPAPEACSSRRERVPRPVPSPLVIDGHEYEITQVVSWDAVDDTIKHFTTVVGWEVMGERVAQRFDSMRAATPGEAGDPLRPRVIQFEIGPSPMELHGPDGVGTVDTPTRPLDVIVRFSQGVQTATLNYYSIADGHSFTPDPSAEPPVLDAPVPPMTLRSVPLTPLVVDPDDAGLHVGFRLTVPADHRFPTGPRTFEVTGVRGTDTAVGSATVAFWGGTPFPQTADPGDEVLPPDVAEPPTGDGSETPPPEDVEVAWVTVSRSAVCLDADGVITRDVVVRAEVRGMTPLTYDVTVGFTVYDDQRFQAMVAPSTTFSSQGAVFTTTLRAGDDLGHKKNKDDRTTFTVTAKRSSDGATDGPVLSDSELQILDWQHASDPVCQ